MDKIIGLFFVFASIYVIALLSVEAIDKELARPTAGGKHVYCQNVAEYYETQHLPIEDQRGIKPYLKGVDCND